MTREITSSVTQPFFCRTTLLLILVLIVAGFSFSPVSAQDGAREELITLGSRGSKQRSAVDSAVPVDVFDATTLRNFGQTETSRMLQYAAPSFNFSTSTISDGTDIVRPATLRGMQPDQTLVLVNGKRRHSTALMHVNGSIGRGTAGVDLNAIPASSIARIEVLRDGAAAQYGSDAIAGVINIVLKDQTETIDPFIQWGQTYEDDGDQFIASVNAGFPVLGGFINLTGEYRDRDRTNRAGPDPRQLFTFDEQVLGQAQLGANDCGGPCTLDSREETFDRLNHRYGDPDSENIYFAWNAGIPIMGDSLEFYTFGTYASREGESGGFYRRDNDARSNPLIHFESIGDGSDGTGFLPLINTEVDDISFGLGFEGEIGSFSYDASFVYGENEFEFIITNSNNVALGLASPTSASAGMLTSDLIVFNLDFSNAFEIADGAALSYGFEYRQDGYELEAGEFASFAGPTTIGDPDTGIVANEPNQFGGTPAAGIQVFPGFQPVNEVDEDRDAFAVYVDFEVDVNERWLVDVAVRYEDYDDFGDTTNFKIATRYFVVDNVALRASASTGFRAPSLQQQFFNNTSTQFVTVNGVPNVPTEVGTFRNDSDVVRNGFGIGELEEEDSTNLSVGFTWTPTDAFSLTADAYYIEVDDRVVLSGRFTAEDDTGGACAVAGSCPIREILQPFGVNSAQFFSNSIDTETSGIDLILDYNFEWAGGQFGMNAGFNWTNTSVDEIRVPDSLIDSPGAENTLFSRQEVIWLESGQPKNHYILTGTYARGPFSFLTRANWFGDVKSTESSGTACEATQTCLDQTFTGKWLVDIRGSWAFTDSIELTVGVDNVFDTTPDQQRADTSFNGIFPFSRRTTPFGFNGGFYYASLNMSFGTGL
ncbi:MAG: TonB-dependent receptor [Gammaproteobacteria bacterium]|nr:MAG: TonB-dependent receptor [Gammaproteobacteria bacterium]